MFTILPDLPARLVEAFAKLAGQTRLFYLACPELVEGLSPI